MHGYSSNPLLYSVALRPIVAKSLERTSPSSDIVIPFSFEDVNVFHIICLCE